ncbi:hypothetical protein FQR65_LT12629 [Abscondita terminalis]|nr:hypothetical protein FQR65_LT12629 [Abscondita terminalis]
MFTATKFNLLLIYRLQVFVRNRSVWSSKSVTTFCDLFDLNRNDFTKYRRNNKIPPLDIKRIEEMSSLCDNLKIDKQDWLRYPDLVKRPPNVLEQYCLHLKEGGFQMVDAKILANYRRIINKTIKFLKASGFLPLNVNVAESFLSHLTPRPQLFLGDLTDENTFHSTHHIILTRFLMWKLNASYETIQKFYRTCSLSKIWSFDQLCQSIQFAEKIGCLSDKVFRYGHILKTPPKNIETLLISVPTLAGLDICKAITLCPYLIRIPPVHLLESYEILQTAQISDKAIQHHLNVFFLTPQTLKDRLNEASKVPEFKIFRNHPRFLRLIVAHNEARSRLTFLKKLKLRCTSVETLCGRKAKFDMYIQDGSDVHSSVEVINYVKRLLHCNANIISTKLRKHLFYRNVSFLSISDSYKYLQELKFSNHAIVDVIQLLLYPRNRLKNAYEAASSYTKDSKISQSVKLNLILYLIEKEYHFTGNGIWNDTENA